MWSEFSSFHIERKSIFAIVVFVTCGMLFVSNFPGLVYHAIAGFYKTVGGGESVNSGVEFLVPPLIQSTIAIVPLINALSLIEWMNKVSNVNTQSEILDKEFQPEAG